MKLVIVNQSSTRVPRSFLGRIFPLMVKQLRQQRVKGLSAQLELTLVFLGKPEARRLNKQFRGKNYPTDVLSFAPIEPKSLGELVLCPEVLKAQAREQGHAYRNELIYMVLHGVLHLLGYDHERNDREAKKMFKLQEEVYSYLVIRF